MTQNTNHLRLLALSFIVGSSFVTAAYAAKSTSQCEEELGEKASNRNLVMECLLEGNKDTPDEKKTLASKKTKAPQQDTNPIARLKTKVDKIEGITWYYDKSTPRPALNSILYGYIGRATGSPSLRVYIQYSGETWLFVHKALIVADDRRFEVNGKWSTDSYTKVWEWNDHLAGPEQMEMLKAVASSKKTTIRFYGRQYVDDRTVTSSEKTAIKNILEGYAALGGT